MNISEAGVPFERGYWLDGNRTLLSVRIEPLGKLSERFAAVRDLVLLHLGHLCVSLPIILEASVPTYPSQLCVCLR